MGRIDEAMNRARMDAGQGTGAAAPTPAPSPWEVDPVAGREQASLPAREPVERASFSRSDRETQARRRSPRPGGKLDIGKLHGPAGAVGFGVGGFLLRLHGGRRLGFHPGTLRC